MRIRCDMCGADCSGDFWQRTEREMRVSPDDSLRVEWRQGYVTRQLCPECQEAEPAKREG